MTPTDFQVTCSKDKVKPLFEPRVLSVQNLLTLHLINTNLGAGVAPNKWMIPIDFSSHVQRSRSNPLLSSLYILIPRLLPSDRFCFYRKDKLEFCTMEGIYVSEAFLVESKRYFFKN